MGVLNKSIVAAFTGGRGSGKTLSMSVEGAIQLISGRKVISNYPLSVKYRGDDGQVKGYQSMPLKVEDMLTFDEELQDAFILMDEANLWTDSRRSQSLPNKLITRLLTLIRKRQLSIMVTTQSFSWLDVRLRFQVDLLVECFDMSFRYHALTPGSFISQSVTDISGVFTGRPLWHGDERTERWSRNTRVRILHGTKYWNVYDTMNEFDIMETLTKYRLSPEEKIISVNGSDKSDKQEKLNELVQTIRDSYPDGFSSTVPEMRNTLSSWGIKVSDREAGVMLKEAGFRYKQTRNGNFYQIDTN